MAQKVLDIPDFDDVDLQMDLLVDGELPEGQRKLLLSSLDKEPAAWRKVGLRFLNRQMEKESVRALMAGGRVVPVELVPAEKTRSWVIGRISFRAMMATAAGLLIALISSTLTFYALSPSNPGASSGTNGTVAQFKTSLPRDLMLSDVAVPVSVPMVKSTEANQDLFPASTGANVPGSKSSTLVQPDDQGGYIVIPVTLSRTKVY
ncbi:MAG TPA: hypothetical protein VGN88_07445 [Phycisphaerae bacterium]|jgi:hypothetical protein